MKRIPFIIEHSSQELKSFFPAIQELADSERDALGFLPAKAFEEAIIRRRLIAALVEANGTRTFAGYLLYSGVFPHAKIQQIAAIPSFRKNGTASALMKALISELERLGFISIRAEVASNLSGALTFYAKLGFERVRERAGGAARGRTIIIHSRQLETDDLFSLASVQSGSGFDFGARRRGLGDVPVFAFDLNVYLDLVRQRDQSPAARRLFGEALGHTIRLVVTDEFVSELRKTSTGLSADPVLQLALQLPRLPKAEVSELNTLAARVYDAIFSKPSVKGAGSEQAKSDAKHVAHAALSNASAFVTRDGAILNARQALLENFGIDIATVEEVLDLLPTEPAFTPAVPIRGDGFQPTALTDLDLSNYFAEVNVPSATASEFTGKQSRTTMVRRDAIQCNGRIIAVGVLAMPKGIDPIARLLVHVRHEHQEAELFADYLIDTLVRSACENAAVPIELIHLSGQSIVNGLASVHGFYRKANATTFSKIAVGRPLTATTWTNAVQQVRRRTGLVLPDNFVAITSTGEINMKLPGGGSSTIGAIALENILSPTIIVWPGRDGVIVPITRAYADELLGTAVQTKLEFVTNHDAAFLSRRGYVNTPRAAKQMRSVSPIIFYESKRNGNGRGAAVAVARIVNSVVVAKSMLESKPDKRLVIDTAEGFSSTTDVLLTTFDNLMPFPNPVGLKKLKELNAIGKANLVSAVSLSSEQITSIITCGWSGGNTQ